MQISPTNLFVTRGYTDRGIPYRKSNVSKTVLTTSCALLGAKSLKTLPKDTFESSGVKTTKQLTVLALLASFGFTLGSIVEGVINKFLQKSSEKKVLAQIQTEKSYVEYGAHQG